MARYHLHGEQPGMSISFRHEIDVQPPVVTFGDNANLPVHPFRESHQIRAAIDISHFGSEQAPQPENVL